MKYLMRSKLSTRPGSTKKKSVFLRNQVLKLSLTLATFAVHTSSARAANDRDPVVVAKVDLTRYVGTWYEIAHAPNFFQRGCQRSTARYGVLSESTVSVVNTCHKTHGKTSGISGVARIPDPKVPAKLKVRFSFYQKGDYWIVALDPDYQWSVVSGPQKKSLFILSRSAPMKPELLRQILESLKQRGFKTEDLVYDLY